MTTKRIALVTASRGTLLHDVLQFAGVRDNLHSVVCDRPCGAEEVAQRHGLPTHRIALRDNAAFSDALLAHFREQAIDYALLLFPRLLVGDVVTTYAGRLLNLHPSLLPAFPGLHSVDQALATSVRHLGNTIHFVDESLDGGPIVLQSVTPRDDGPEVFLRHRLFVQQCQMVIQLVRWLADNRIVLDGKKARVKNAVFDQTDFSPNLDASEALTFTKVLPAHLLISP